MNFCVLTDSESAPMRPPLMNTDSFQIMVVKLRCADRACFLLAFFLLAGLLTGCIPNANDQSELTVRPSVMVPFEDLFTPEDTLVLDPSVILGQLSFVDVDASGSVLVTDEVSNLVHLFAYTGQHQATYIMDTCFPIDGEHRVWTSRFADDDRIILSTKAGTMVVFDRSGNCLAAKRSPLYPLRSFCARGDSVFVFRGPRGLGNALTSVAGVFTMDLELQREIRLENPQFEKLNITHLGSGGRDLDCFSDGPYYKYHEDMDARPAYGRSEVVRTRPDFFVRRDQDLPRGQGPSLERIESLNAFPSLTGLYALDDDSRLMVFTRIGNEFRREVNSSAKFMNGLSIVSNNGKFGSMSTVYHTRPKTARHGYLYFVGDNVQADDGDVGNPTVIRYRFNVPEATDG